MAKKIFYDDDARSRVLAGAKELYDAVKVTMGPKGRNVVINKGYGGPSVTHDGVTVAKAVEIAQSPKDEAEWGKNIGAELIKEAASKTNDKVGDGTTTATVLAFSLLVEANRLIAAGHNPMDLKKGLDQAAKEVLNDISTMSEAIADSSKRIAEVATISAGDSEIGDMIAEVIKAVGAEGSVTVEQSQGLDMEKEIVEGFKIDRGYVSQYMVTDTARMEAVYERPMIAITDKKISSIQEILPLLEKLAQGGKKELVLIAEDVEGEALATLVLNRLKGVFNVLAIKAPAFGDRRKAMLEDIAILTGAEIISEERGLSFESVGLEVLGSARKIIASKDDTTLIEGLGKDSVISERIAQIKDQIKNTKNAYDKENLEKRLSAMAGKVAVIKVGGATEAEIGEKKDRVDDAVAATKAAIEEGIVPGGGIAMLNLATQLGEKSATETLGNANLLEASSATVNARVLGGAILMVALEKPFAHLMENSGISAEQKIAEVRNHSKTGWGFDVNNPDKLVDLKAAGIVDPAKVTREAIQNAVSIAGTAMTMGALVVDIPEEKPAAGPAMGGGMGMDY